ncbi:MAG: hypothetical protein K9N51_12100 [Candidatus Pacebacteria bacterium]|nr:hypothetical protein [Candidatus Paceibacterota bacterium]
MRQLARTLIPTVLCIVILLAAACMTHHYIVPPPIVKDYEDPIPFQAGVLMSRQLRDQWYSTESMRKRVDVPVGKVVLDFAKAYLQNAFEITEKKLPSEIAPETTKDFYTIRYYERRSRQGILIWIKSIEYMLEGVDVYCKLDVSIEDSTGTEVVAKTYYGKGTPREGKGLLQRTLYEENNIELSTAAAMELIYSELLEDIRQTFGSVPIAKK